MAALLIVCECGSELLGMADKYQMKWFINMHTYNVSIAKWEQMQTTEVVNNSFWNFTHSAESRVEKFIWPG